MSMQEFAVMRVNYIITICERKRSVMIHLIVRRTIIPKTPVKLKHVTLHSVCRLRLVVSINAPAVNFVFVLVSR